MRVACTPRIDYAHRQVVVVIVAAVAATYDTILAVRSLSLSLSQPVYR